jgi:putative spermidine/putrescine transport system substrate-binding protein
MSAGSDHKSRATTTNVTRRGAMRVLAGAGAAGLTMPWVTTKARAAGQLTVVLNAGLLAKLWIDELHPAFEKETGAKLIVQQSLTAGMLGMLKNQKANPPDLMQFSEAGVFLARSEGLLRAHDPAHIPNFKYLRASFNLADNFSAGCTDAMNTLHYNTKAIDKAPDSWTALWSPAYKGKIAIPPPALNSGIRMVTTAAQIATGKPFKEAQYDLDAGLAELAKLKKNDVIAYTSIPQAIQMLQSGQVPLLPFYGIYLNTMIAAGAPFAPATNLKEGVQGEIVGLNMPVNAPNVELAEVYVNMSLSKEFQTRIDEVLHCRCGHKEVPPSAETLKLIGDPENTLYADWAFLSRERSKITSKWNEIFG